MSNFTTTALVNERVLVQGTDFLGVEGKTVLDSSQWTQVNQHKQFDQATDEFDAAVAAFFQPITDAAEKVKTATTRDEDPSSFVVLSEEVEGVQAKPAHRVSLTKDSIILRLLEENPQTDRLAWVGDDLEILAAAQAPSATAQPSAAQVGAEATGLPLDEV
jgi:hypothetical protein